LKEQTIKRFPERLTGGKRWDFEPEVIKGGFKPESLPKGKTEACVGGKSGFWGRRTGSLIKGP